MKRSTFLLGLPLAALSLSAAPARPRARVLVIVGPSTHAPGTHEVGASGRLIAHCLENMANLPGVRADAVEGWPQDDALLEAADHASLLSQLGPRGSAALHPQRCGVDRETRGA